MTPLLLLALPWGYLIAALFLLAAIILFIVAIFMKDTGDNYGDALEEKQSGQQEQAYEGTTYEDSFDRYPNLTDERETGAVPDESDLREMMADTSENLGETRMFTPAIEIPEPESFEEPEEEPMEVFEEPKEEEEVFESPVVSSFEQFEEPEEPDVEEIPEVPEVEEVDEDADVKRVDTDAFEEELVLPERKRFWRSSASDDDGEEDDVPKPAPKGKSGMSFAEEVRRLIEEEEKRNQNS